MEGDCIKIKSGMLILVFFFLVVPWGICASGGAGGTTPLGGGLSLLIALGIGYAIKHYHESGLKREKS